MKHLIKALSVMFCLGALLVSCTEENKNDGKFTITVNSDNATMGKAYGSGEYESGSTVRIWGTPEPGYQFARWNDGNTDNPRNITVTADMTYTAFFSTVGGDTPGDTTGGGEVPGDFNASLTVDGRSYDCVALLSYGMDESGELFNLELWTGEGGDTDPVFYMFFEPHTGTQGFDQGASCNFLENPDDMVIADNGYEYPHYQTINGCNYSINVTALDMTAQTVTVTSSGELFDVKRAVNGEGAHKINYSVSIDGYWQYPSAGKSK